MSSQTASSTAKPLPIIIVGAGPVGLLLALRLAQSNIPILVLEAHPTLLPTTRAMVYMPVVIPVLQKLGIYEKVVEQAYCNHKGVVWRDLEGNLLGKLRLGNNPTDDRVNGDVDHHSANESVNLPEPSGFGGVLLCPQAKMAAIILEELQKYDGVEIRFGLRCVGVDDSSKYDVVRVMVHNAQHGSVEGDMDSLIEARYVIGCDGANSAVRRMSCIPFEGFTYHDWTLVGCDVICDLEKDMGWTPLNFVVDPEVSEDQALSSKD